MVRELRSQRKPELSEDEIEDIWQTVQNAHRNAQILWLCSFWTGAGSIFATVQEFAKVHEHLAADFWIAISLGGISSLLVFLGKRIHDVGILASELVDEYHLDDDWSR